MSATLNNTNLENSSHTVDSGNAKEDPQSASGFDDVGKSGGSEGLILTGVRLVTVFR